MKRVLAYVISLLMAISLVTSSSVVNATDFSNDFFRYYLSDFRN